MAKYKVYYGTTPNNVNTTPGSHIIESETFPISITRGDGEHYFKVTETNSVGESTPSAAIKGVSIAGGVGLTFLNGINRVTITAVTCTGASDYEIEAETATNVWTKQHSGVTQYVVESNDKMYSKWRYRGINGANFKGSYSTVLTYTNPMLDSAKPVLTFQNLGTTIKFTYTGGSNAIVIRLVNKTNGTTIKDFDLTSKSTEITLPTTNTTYTAVAICGLKTLESNSVAVDVANPVQNLATVVSNSTIDISWNNPINNNHDSIDVNWIAPSGTTGSVNVAKTVNTYSIAITETGIWNITVAAKYGSTNANTSATATTTLPAVTALAVASTQKNHMTVSWTVPKNTNYTDFLVRYKLESSQTWTYITISRFISSTDIKVSTTGTYNVNVAARYGALKTEVWTGSNQNVAVVVDSQGTSVGVFPFTISKEFGGGEISPIAGTAIIPNLSIPKGYFYMVALPTGVRFDGYPLGEVLDISTYPPDTSYFALASENGDEYDLTGTVNRVNEGISLECDGTFEWNKTSDKVYFNIYSQSSYGVWNYVSPAVGFSLPIYSSFGGQFYSYYFWDSIDVSGYIEVFDDNPLGLFTLTVAKNGNNASLSWTASARAEKYEIYRNNVLHSTVTSSTRSATIQQTTNASFYIKAIVGKISRDSNSVNYQPTINVWLNPTTPIDNNYYYIPAGFTNCVADLTIISAMEMSYGYIRLIYNGVTKKELYIEIGQTEVRETISFAVYGGGTLQFVDDVSGNQSSSIYITLT